MLDVLTQFVIHITIGLNTNFCEVIDINGKPLLQLCRLNLKVLCGKKMKF